MKFYHLGIGDRWLPSEGTKYDRYVAWVCPICGKEFKNLQWPSPRSIDIFRKKTFPDVLHGVDVLFSERFMQLYNESDCTGILGVDEIHQYNFPKVPKAKRDQIVVPQKYFFPRVAMSNMRISEESSFSDEGRKFYPICAGCNPIGIRGAYSVYKFAFDTTEYEGYDIFEHFQTGYAVYVSEKFVEFMKKNKLHGMYVVPQEQYESGPHLIFAKDRPRTKILL